VTIPGRGAGAGEEPALAAALERHRRELRVHCYRMVGSYEDAEDLVQETMLRAWRGREGFEGRASLRSWLYRIATNVCLDHLAARPRRPVRRGDPTLAAGDRTARARPLEIPWLQPFPDAELDAREPAAPDDLEPEAIVVERETIELTFIVALQALTPRQRAVLLLRDLLGWSQPDTAAALGVTAATVKTALQRARPALRAKLPARRTEWIAGTRPTDEERRLLARFISASENADIPALRALLREDAWQTMPPYREWFRGREAMLEMWSAAMTGPDAMGEWRALPAAANRQPAVANYVRPPGEKVYRASNLDVLRVEEGQIAEITTFEGRLFPHFGLPAELPG
jgi:RNA polymerase sigma-70 factor (ECF subfamily)